MPGSVVIVTGPPGAGKSTSASSLARTYPKAVHLHTDDFWHSIVAGSIPPYLPESHAQNQTVVEVIAGAAFTYAAGGFTVVVDGIIGPWMLDHYRRAAARHPDIALRYIVLRPSREVTLARAQQRTRPDALVDDVPILSLWDQFTELGEFEPHSLDNTSQTPDETLRALVAAAGDDRFRLFTP